VIVRVRLKRHAGPVHLGDTSPGEIAGLADAGGVDEELGPHPRGEKNRERHVVVGGAAVVEGQHDRRARRALTLFVRGPRIVEPDHPVPMLPDRHQLLAQRNRRDPVVRQASVDLGRERSPEPVVLKHGDAPQGHGSGARA